MFFKKRKQTARLPITSDGKSGIYYDDPAFKIQLDFIGLTEHKLRVIAAVAPYITKHNEYFVSTFYNALEEIPELANIISSNTTSQRLRLTLNKHIAEMFSGRIDDYYITQREKVAKVHVRIGLSTKWYLAALQKLEDEIRKIIFDLPFPLEDQIEVLDSFTKLMSLEKQIVLEQYEIEFHRIQKIKQQQVRNEVKHTLGTIAFNLECQASATSDSLQDLAANSHQVTEQTNEVIDASLQTKQLAEAGYNHMQLLDKQSEEINEQTVHMTTIVTDLDHSSTEIQQVVNIVKQIADQTNLLALNSSIEAARAGEHGKGFAVVAEEIHKLADETKESVEQIATLIEGSTKMTTSVVESIHQIQHLVDEGVHLNNQTLASFEQIATSLERTINDFKQVGEKIHRMNEVVHKIESSSSEVADAALKLEQTIESF